MFRTIHRTLSLIKSGWMRRMRFHSCQRLRPVAVEFATGVFYHLFGKLMLQDKEKRVWFGNYDIDILKIDFSFLLMKNAFFLRSDHEKILVLDFKTVRFFFLDYPNRRLERRYNIRFEFHYFCLVKIFSFPENIFSWCVFGGRGERIGYWLQIWK